MSTVNSVLDCHSKDKEAVQTVARKEGLESCKVVYGTSHNEVILNRKIIS